MHAMTGTKCGAQSGEGDEPDDNVGAFTVVQVRGWPTIEQEPVAVVAAASSVCGRQEFFAVRFANNLCHRGVAGQLAQSRCSATLWRLQ